MLCRFSDGPIMLVKEMANSCIATNEDKLFCCFAGGEFLQHPEQAFHCHVHYIFGCFFAGCQVNHMRNAFKRLFHTGTVSDRSSHYLNTVN